MDNRIHFKETRFGFEFGSMRIERTASFPDKSVVITLLTQKQEVEIRFTKSGIIRISPVRKTRKQNEHSQSQKSKDN